ncbi:MAG: chromosome partitioning protein ParA [Flavobacteriaceae bacterium]|nr:chromosome partitioning protein ParA [Flavobacteriaceae bacterium]
MESNTTPNNRLKIILVITLVLLFGTGFYTLNLYNSNIETQEQLIAEKELVLKGLNNMAAQYDIAIDNNDVANNKLIQARERIEGLMDSLKISDNNVRSLWRYKKKFLVLQDEMKELMLENNTLKEENSMLTNTLDSTKVQLNDRIVYNDSLLNQNTQLATIVRDVSVLSAVSLKGLGVIIRSSGKLIPTERASRADELKICYTVPKNKLVTTGEKDFFVQILDPKNNILGENKQINFEEKILNYSLSSKFNYTGKNLDICEFVKPRGKKFEKGRYIVNIFDEAILVSSSQFMLK